MRIKRFFDKDISSVIRSVRNDLGADAVILSNKQMANGIEIVAAIDYDEELFGNMNAHNAGDIAATNSRHADVIKPDTASLPNSHTSLHENSNNSPRTINIEWSQEPTIVQMRKELESLHGLVQNQLTGFAWGDIARKQPQRLSLLRKLMGMGLAPDLCNTLSKETTINSDEDVMWRQALGLLARRLPVAEQEIIEQGGQIALVGPTGVGKTTTIAKLAARFSLRHGRQHMALVTTDSYRIGAHEQLRIYGRILDVPVRVANNGDELHDILMSLQDKRLVLIDTAGMSQRDVRLSEQFAELRKGSPAIRNYLVMSATTQRSALSKTVKAFSDADLQGCIVTKIDEATSLGNVLSVITDSNLPLSYIADGQRVPEDIHIARPNAFIQRAGEMIHGDDTLLEHELFSIAAQEAQAHVHG